MTGDRCVSADVEVGKRRRASPSPPAVGECRLVREGIAPIELGRRASSSSSTRSKATETSAKTYPCTTFPSSRIHARSASESGPFSTAARLWRSSEMPFGPVSTMSTFGFERQKR